MFVHKIRIAVVGTFSPLACGCWHKEIFADLVSVLLGRLASIWGAKDRLVHPLSKMFYLSIG